MLNDLLENLYDALGTGKGIEKAYKALEKVGMDRITAGALVDELHRPKRMVDAKIHSLGGEERPVELLEQTGYNSYVVRYNGVKCTAIFNGFVGRYYADDLYGILPE